MLFNSWIFLALVIITFFVYYTVPKLGLGSICQVGLLLIASLVFYAYETPILVLLLLFSITVNYIVSKRIVLLSSKNNGRKLIAWAILFNLSIIAFFKYGKLICSSILPYEYSSNVEYWFSNIPLPIGISFYTFQAISLVVDLLRQREKGLNMEKLEEDFVNKRHVSSFLNIAFYIAFFPQLIAGPIVKAHDFIKQITLKRYSEIRWQTVVRSLIIGYFLKMYVADNLKEVTVLLNTVSLDGMSKPNLLVLFYGYSFQIFADFAGYSLIAIGLGALFGYKLPVNFNFPYISRSITEFWRRWHISLSSWLREYLYIPLGGNRKGEMRTYINLMIVMLLGGLWHGAAWSYMVWGGAHGVLLAVERKIFQTKLFKSFQSNQLVIWLQILVTFHLVSVLWLMFVMPDFSDVISYFSALINGSWGLGSPQHLFSVVTYGSPIILYHLYAYYRENKQREIASKRSRFIEPIALSAMLFLIIVNSGTTGAFIYFQF